MRLTAFPVPAILLLALLPGPVRISADPDSALALKGPPWISIELPANPYDQDTRGAYLLVHAFHHGTPIGFPVSGRAEGLVDGRRRTVKLDFQATSRPGVYALRKQWPDEGEWSLVVSVTQGRDTEAQALVQISGGEVIAVRVPTERRGGTVVPRLLTQAEIEGSLRDRTVRMAARSG